MLLASNQPSNSLLRPRPCCFPAVICAWQAVFCFLPQGGGLVLCLTGVWTNDAEHLAAVEIMQLKHIIILQNKIDLISESAAQNQHEAIQVHTKPPPISDRGQAGCKA